MNIGRIFASAVVRKVAYTVTALAMAAVLSLCGISKAHAYDLTSCDNANDNCTVGQAYSVCLANITEYMAGDVLYSNPRCTTPNPALTSGTWSGYLTSTRNCPSGCTIAFNLTRWARQCTPPATWDDASKTCKASCANKPDYTFTPSYGMPGATVTCNGGCAVANFSNGDGTFTGKPSVLGQDCNILPDCAALGLSGYTFNAYQGTCEPPNVECDTNQTKNPLGQCVDACPTGMHLDEAGACAQDDDNCPAGNVRAPSGECLPGDGQCAVGEARRDNGTCGIDADGDGEADEDDEDPENDPDKESMSGGESCDNPPSCSGGPIDCGMVRIQWRIDCNTRKDITISGGSCDSVPVCTGKNCNAMEYSQLLMQWRTSCKDAATGTGGDNQDIIDALTGPTGSISDQSGGGDIEDLGPGMGEEVGEDFEPDGDGLGWSSSCPTLPPITFDGRTFEFDVQPMCDWFALGGVLVLTLTGLACLRIVAGATA